MFPLIALLLIVALFGGLGFALHALWVVLVIALVLWLVGFLFRAGTGGRGWYGRGW